MPSDVVTATPVSALDELLNLPLRGENPYVQEWKKKGGLVVGFVCSYVPEELLVAHTGGVANARILPIRLGATGCTTTEDADAYMHKFICSFPRCLLQVGLDGEYDSLDGLVFTSCCEHMRRVYEPWRDRVGVGIQSMISVPHSNTGDHHLQWYYDEAMNVLSDIDRKYGYHTTTQSLRDAIKTYNRYRELMLELYRLRALDKPLLTGSEAMKIALAGFNMPKDVFNAKLEAAIAEIKERPGIENVRARILISGSYIDDTRLIDVIESTGAVVVTDALCMGRKHIEGMVDTSPGVDPRKAIVERYFSKISCPRMIHGLPDRLAFLNKLIAEAKVDGVILEKMAFCDNHGIENHIDEVELEKAGVPVLKLEREYLATDTGRYKTRVQAFLEKIS